MTTTIKAGGVAQFVGMIPAMLGYQPTDSVVLIPFQGNKTIGAMRFDTGPAFESPEEVAATMLGHVLRIEGIERVAALVYTSSAHLATLPLLAAINHRAVQTGVKVVDLIYVAADGWGSTLVDTEPHPLSEIDGSLVPAEMTVQAGVLAGTELPDVPENTIEIAERAIANIPAELLFASMIVAEPRTPQGWYERLLITEPSEAHAMSWPILAAAAERPSLRDIFLVQAVAGESAGHTAEDAQSDWESGEEYPAELAMIMWGEGAQPDPARLTAALERYRWAAAAVPSVSAGSLSMCAWISWALGRSSHAEHYATRALEVDPEHGLSEIVLSFIRAGHLPAWAFTKRDS